MEVLETIQNQIRENPILIYMKGSPDQPQCGFSSQASQMLISCGKRFAYIDILANPDIRANLPAFSEWPTFPQLFVSGELVGGCDIISEMYDSGELQPLLEEAAGESESWPWGVINWIAASDWRHRRRFPLFFRSRKLPNVLRWH